MKLTDEQVIKLFRALEWAGRERTMDGTYVPVCLVCGAERWTGKPRDGHEYHCIYAEVFYK